MTRPALLEKYKTISRRASMGRKAPNKVFPNSTFLELTKVLSSFYGRNSKWGGGGGRRHNTKENRSEDGQFRPF